MATRDLDRLAQRVYTHRLALYDSRLDAARAAGISKDTWKKAEEGKFVQDVKLARIDHALGWATGGCIAIAEGGEPVLVDDGRGVATPEASTVKPVGADAMRQKIFETARRKLPSAPIGELGGFADEMVEILRGTGDVADGE